MKSHVSLRLAPALLLLLCLPGRASAYEPLIPQASRGRADAERSGTHDANNIRTLFWNYGMVGDYPADPGNVDLSVFHSVEVPKGSGMNYSDGTTPFVLAHVRQRDGSYAYIMETGFRERQGQSPLFNRQMRFEPRPGFFQPDPGINRGRSPAVSNDSRTWPGTWPDRVHDPDDPGWSGSWDGYFGKRPAADEESFTVMDDDFYDAFNFYPDSRDSTRRGLGLRVEVRGFQWSNPQARNVVFWHYDITNESTTDYDSLVFGLYMDAGVGGSAFSCDGVYESDDDNAFFDKNAGLNLVYTYDTYGHGVDLSGNCSRTGYLGYAYMETPGNSTDGIDNDNDGIIDESRSSGPGQLIVGRDNIRAYVNAHYDMTRFVAAYGPLENRPGYRNGRWWTGDEDMDWDENFDDLGADGIPDSHDTGEGDGIPTAGEPNFDKTDVHESDQIGLTAFKMNRIKSAPGNPSTDTDNVLFFTEKNDWPERLWAKFNNSNPPARFDSALASNYNIAFLFASGPFPLLAAQHERFSLSLAYGADLTELRSTVKIVQLIYNANYQFAVPPPLPTVTAEGGDHYVRLSWDDASERGRDPVVGINDFEGYRIYRSTDPEFLDPKVITNGTGSDLVGNGKPIAQFDRVDGQEGYSPVTADGVSYYLGNESGITHTWTDTTVTNGQQYYYAVCAYDYGPKYAFKADSVQFYPSENAITVSRTLRGGVILPINAVAVRPNPHVPGYVGASADSVIHVHGDGFGAVTVSVVNSASVLDGHVFRVQFGTTGADSIRAVTYALYDTTTGKPVFKFGTDLDGVGVGPVGDGLLLRVATPQLTAIDSSRTGFAPGSPTPLRLLVSDEPGLSPNLRRIGYPDDITIEFDSVTVDTSVHFDARYPALPTKFRIIAHSPDGDHPLKCIFRDLGTKDGRLGSLNESFDVLTYANGGNPSGPHPTWRFEIDPSSVPASGIPRLTKGDVFHLRLRRPLGTSDTLLFRAKGDGVDAARAREDFSEKPYVVPNPYVGSASFEPGRFAVSGRGERRIEFRAVPRGATVRVYTIRGSLVQTLRQDGSMTGMVPWDLRTKDNLDIAPGLYLYHVDAPGVGTYVGKFAVIK